MNSRYLGIDHVQLAAPAGCEEEARAFYHGVLGMPEIRKPESLQRRGGVWFVCGAQEVHIGVQADFVPAKKAHPAFLVKDLASLKERPRQHGEALQEAIPVDGVDRFHAEDPFGNRLEFVERL
ncbi:VOC family protein [Paenibacillus sp. P26]|nr:VOC family protein [Paenibacillus sp. P26]